MSKLKYVGLVPLGIITIGLLSQVFNGQSFSTSVWTIVAAIFLAAAVAYGAYKDESAPKGAILLSNIAKGAAVLVAVIVLLIGPEKMSLVWGEIQTDASAVADDFVSSQLLSKSEAEVAQRRQAEIDQATHDTDVARAIAQANALKPVPDDQVRDGIDHLKGTSSGLYDFFIDQPLVLNAKAVTLKPGEFFEHVMEPNTPTARCIGFYPPRNGAVITPNTGSAAIANQGKFEFTTISYEFAKGTFDPIKNKCGP